MPGAPPRVVARGATAPLLEARGIRVEIAGTPILHGADLTAQPGRLVAVVGPNGAGKSTLARVVAGLQRRSGGSVRWHGEELRRLHGRRLARLRAFVPQRPRVPEGIVVREAVLIGRSPHFGPLQRLSHGDRDACERAMERAGVLAFAERPLTTLSGGELQRVQVAVGLAQETPLLIADEPTSALDLGAAAAMAQLLRDLADDGLAIVLVVHDLALAAAVADEVVVLSHGRAVASGTPEQVLVPARLREVWQVDADLEQTTAGRTALHVTWLRSRREAPRA
ncbi:ABC transporter ATP-binding protein [Conexibacter sp. CPCC 206217]|uniref:ABC transporter ATP-binding protein n=1 Tax=Conexibacter sp. CPCC 206217 TaxID=3064574 RepID=UPI00271880A6|nr:ABC transporter ATP-binding protein [Conexibacter sp. CPCC 206217]MDO8212132.1 ABC transporter ATP-binding protein [Conexibacter sp. CPCC 206217]